MKKSILALAALVSLMLLLAKADWVTETSTDSESASSGKFFKPVQFELSAISFGQVSTFHVPPDKRLIITFVTVITNQDSPPAPIVDYPLAPAVYTTVGGTPVTHVIRGGQIVEGDRGRYFPNFPVAAYVYTASEQVEIFADPDTYVTPRLELPYGTLSRVHADFTFSGRLVDVSP